MLDIVFYSDSPVRFNSRTIGESPLGGSETAIAMMSEGLAARGHSVTVYNRCIEPDDSGAVKYRSIFLLDKDNVKCDVFVSSRSLGGLFRKFSAKKTVYWMQDNPAAEVYANDLRAYFEKALPRVGKVFMTSNFQKEEFLKIFPSIPPEKLFLTRNGVDETTISGLKGTEKNPGKFIYATTPFRGLSGLVDMWPGIKKALPRAELHIYGDMQVYQMENGEWQAIYDRAAATEGVFVHGSLPQKELAKEMSDAYLFLYPNTFDETSCISAMNSISLGVPIITTKRGALPETVRPGCGVLIDGNPDTHRYREEFIEKTLALANDMEAWEKMHSTCLEQDYTWKSVVDQWEKLFSEMP